MRVKARRFGAVVAVTQCLRYSTERNKGSGGSAVDIDSYATWAAIIPVGQPPIRDRGPLLSYLGIGLASETGELAGEIKKLLRDGTWDRDRIADELGDIAYYFARLCAVIEVEPSQVLERSAAKIKARIGQS